MATETRIPFNEAGPFVVRARHFKFAGLSCKVGSAFPAKKMSDEQRAEYERLVSPQRIKRLYEGRFIDVSPPTGPDCVQTESEDIGLVFDPDVHDLYNPSKGICAGQWFITKSRKKLLRITEKEAKRLSKMRNAAKVLPSGIIED